MLVDKAMDDPVNFHRYTVQPFNQFIPESLAFWLVISKLDPYSMLVNATFTSIILGFSSENIIQC